MTTTPAQRIRAHRARRRRREVQLTIEVSENDFREIALRGYADAASTNRKARETAVAVFVSGAPSMRPLSTRAAPVSAPAWLRNKRGPEGVPSRMLRLLP
jgi:hypothetical protein